MSLTNTLKWNPNSESDLAGYNVYREIGAGTGFTKVNAALIPKGTETYLDTNTAVDGDYIYNVTAVDTAGNESLHSVNVDTVINVNPPAPPSGLSVVTA